MKKEPYKQHTRKKNSLTMKKEPHKQHTRKKTALR